MVCLTQLYAQFCSVRKNRDAIALLKSRILETGVATEKELKVWLKWLIGLWKGVTVDVCVHGDHLHIRRSKKVSVLRLIPPTKRQRMRTCTNENFYQYFYRSGILSCFHEFSFNMQCLPRTLWVVFWDILAREPQIYPRRGIGGQCDLLKSTVQLIAFDRIM